MLGKLGIMRIFKGKESQLPPELIKAQDSSRESTRIASGILQDELDWYQEQLREAQKKRKEFKQHKGTAQERGKWGKYQQNLVSSSSSLSPFTSSIEDLEQRQTASEEELAEVKADEASLPAEEFGELVEIIIEDFKKITQDSLAIISAIKQIKRPTKRLRSFDAEDGENAMRFQVQWDTSRSGPTFSEVATASSKTGVTVSQAVDALNATLAKVEPKAAQKAAELARDKQVTWLESRPPEGVSTQNYSWSEYFNYKNYTDARLDVENLRGHNLRE
jgi:hypothetical protein